MRYLNINIESNEFFNKRILSQSGSKLKFAGKVSDCGVFRAKKNSDIMDCISDKKLGSSKVCTKENLKNGILKCSQYHTISGATICLRYGSNNRCLSSKTVYPGYKCQSGSSIFEGKDFCKSKSIVPAVVYCKNYEKFEGVEYCAEEDYYYLQNSKDTKNKAQSSVRMFDSSSLSSKTTVYT